MFSAVSRGIPSFGDVSYHAPVVGVDEGVLLGGVPVLAPAAGVSRGQTLTAGANGALSVDTGFLFEFGGPVLGDRVLITSQAPPANGIYTVTTLGDATHKWILTRAIDASSTALLPFGSTAWCVSDGTLWQGGAPGDGWVPMPLSIVTPALQTPISGFGLAVLSGVSSARAGLPIFGKQPIVHVYTAGAAWATPVGVLWVLVELVGAGGQGGGSAANAAGSASQGGGGGGGGYASKLLLGSALSGNYTVTVGTGGSTGGAGAAGQNGGLSSFAGAGITTVQGAGGIGGPAGVTSAAAAVTADGGAGGAGTGGDVGISGGHGSPGNVIAALALPTSHGGGSELGSGAAPNSSSNANGRAPDGGYGGGGSGAAGSSGSVARTGGAGFAGIVVVTEYYGP